MAQTELFDLVPSRKEPELFRFNHTRDVLSRKREQLLNDVVGWFCAIGMRITLRDGSHVVGTLRDLKATVFIKHTQHGWSKGWYIYVNHNPYGQRLSKVDMRTVRELAADPVKWHKKADAREIARLHFRLTGQKLRQKAVK